MRISPSLSSGAQRYQQWRREFHSWPETAYAEEHTAARIAALLHSWDLEVHEQLGGTGVVGVLRLGADHSNRRSLALRADMDALSLQEENDFAHRSRRAGFMHACGHDGHITMLLAAAEELARLKPSLASAGALQGDVVFIFQPAEEGGAGAERMIRAGLLERFPVQAVFGLHNWPGLPFGQFALSPGPIMASSNEFNLTLRGQGAHAAMPHLGRDPVPPLAEIILAWQSILTRTLNPLEPAVLSVTRLCAGSASNILASEASASGTVRTFSLAALERIEEKMRQIAGGIAQAHALQSEFRFERNYPPTINAPQACAFARSVIARFAGEENLLPQPQSMGAEDFSYFLQRCEGCYAFLGAGPSGADGDACGLHNAHFDFNDGLLPIGAQYWVSLALAWLSATAA